MSKEFQWTDALVKEFVCDLLWIDKVHGKKPTDFSDKGFGSDKLLQQFKASHQPKEDKQSKLEKIADIISRIYYYGKFKAETVNERMLEDLLTQVGYWPTNENEILKRNNTPKEDKPKWEIVEFSHNGIVYCKGYDGKFRTGAEHDIYARRESEFFDTLIGSKIHSVKRKDGEVFSVGDEVNIYGRIKSFGLFGDDNSLMFVDCERCRATFTQISKPKEEVKEPERHDTEKENELINQLHRYYKDNYVKKEQVDKMMEDAFNAARDKDFNPNRQIEIPIAPNLYPTFQDYKNTLK